MADRHLVAGLDLGSTKTCAVIAELAGDLPRAPLAKILGVGLAKNSGVRRGMVRDIDETTRSVAAALKDAEEDVRSHQQLMTKLSEVEREAGRMAAFLRQNSQSRQPAQQSRRTAEISRAAKQ